MILLLTKPGHQSKQVHLRKAPEHELELCLELREGEPSGPQDAGMDEDAGASDADR